MEIKDFSEIETEFIERVHTMVWCNAATVDSKQRPRSRILHPIWEGSTGWIGTHTHSFKARHLANNPHISLAYTSNINKPVYVDCTAEWIHDQDEQKRIWNLFKNAPEPLGYDPVLAFGNFEDGQFGLLKLTPWRIEIPTFPAESHAVSPVWRRRN
jgi:general stress protein 26